MAQEMSISELRRISALHGGMTPESWLMDWAAGEIERRNDLLKRTLPMVSGAGCGTLAAEICAIIVPPNAEFSDRAEK